MKNLNRKHDAAPLIILPILALLSTGLACHAGTTLYWDALATHNCGTAPTGCTDGGGTWNVSALWYNGTSDAAWVAGSDAVIGCSTTTAANRITGSAAITVGNITFNAEGTGGLYTISSSANITLQGSTAGELTLPPLRSLITTQA